MSFNTFGKRFALTTCGESHGPAYVAIVDGCPAGVELSEKDFERAMARRRPGQSQQVSQRRETDHVEILSGVFEGKTTGASIGLMVKNQDARERDYDSLKDKFRPGHADFTYFKKYGVRDHRGGGRSSARETALWVAASVIAKKCLPDELHIHAHLAQMGKIKAEKIDYTQVNQNDFFSADINKVDAMVSLIKSLRKSGDSIGGLVKVNVENMPIGLGEPVFEKLDANLAKALMGIPAAKAVAIGDGFDVVTQRGSEHRDELTPEGFLSNHSGGVLGGISTGQNLQLSVAFKPTSSILTPAKTVDVHNQACESVVTGRHDPCVAIRAVPVVEAVVALVLADHYLQC
jgi:chorismate synthase